MSRSDLRYCTLSEKGENLEGSDVDGKKCKRSTVLLLSNSDPSLPSPPHYIGLCFLSCSFFSLCNSRWEREAAGEKIRRQQKNSLFLNISARGVKNSSIFNCFFIFIGLDFYVTLFNTALPPLWSTVSEDAGIEPRTFATLALAVIDAPSTLG
jgi:hypothetical protein